jgi:hypothetical protein
MSLRDPQEFKADLTDLLEAKVLYDPETEKD